MNHQAGLADVNRTQLFIEIGGAGEAVVFVHGLGANRRVWDSQVPFFVERCTVLRYDLRGHGKSALPTTEGYLHADDLKALLDYLEIERAHLVGQSMGGEVTLDFALTYPERVDKLVLVDSTIGGYEWSDEWNASWTPVFEAASADGTEKLLELVLQHPLLAYSMRNPDVNHKLTVVMSGYSGWHFVNPDPVLLPEPPAVQRLHEVTAPTLVIIGAHDLPDFHAMAAELARIPGATKVEFADCGHVVQMETPERFNEVVLGFLAEPRDG